MTIKLRTIALAFALAINFLFPAREARAGNSLSLNSHDAASSSDAQASRASKHRRHARAGRKSARRSGRHYSASRPAQPNPVTSNNNQPNTRTDIEPATEYPLDDNNNNNASPRPTPTPSLERQFPKAYKIKKP